MGRVNKSEILIDLIYIFAIGINVWIITDTITNGQTSTLIGQKFSKATKGFNEWQKRERDYQEIKPWVVFEAITILDESEQPK